MKIWPAGLGLIACLAIGCWTVSTAAASPFYDYDIIAKTGVGSISDIKPGASINDKGEVAFVGRFGDNTFEEFFDRVIRWDPVAGIVSLSIDDHSTVPFYTIPQLRNNASAASSLFRNGSVLTDFPRASLYGPAAGTESIFAQYSTGYIFNVSVNNLGNAVFERVETYNPGQQNQISIVYHKGGALQNDFVTFANFTGDPNVTDLQYHPRISDDDTTVMRSGDTSTSPITAYKSNGPQVVASTGMGFDALGRQPGISDDGSVLVFWGNLNTTGAATLGLTPGPGIFACTREGPDFSPPFRVTGGVKGGIPRADLGYDANRNPLYFTSDPIDTPIGVSHLHTGSTSSLNGDSFIVCFLATPSAASRPNPALPGKPLLFGAALGVWTVRVDIEKQLAPPSGTPPARVYHPWGAIPVGQIGDTFGGNTINQLVLADPIARASTDKLLNPRTEHRMDHQVLFWANTNNGPMLVRGRYLDSDEDGLPDHWEQAGGGIDMDGDGVVDLDLHAMGADPNKRDLFLQIDWGVPNNTPGNTPYSNEPAPGATSALSRMFAAAPALTNGIPAGIALHIDAGPGVDKGPGSKVQPFSRNMGAGPLRGGNLIGQAGNPTQHLDVIYYGVPGQVPVPLTYPGVTTRAFQDIKDSTLLLEDKGARELAFRYAVLGDFQDFLYTSGSTGVPGNQIGGAVQSATSTSLTAPFTFGYTIDSGAIKITSGPGAGQVRGFATSTAGPTINIDPKVPWTTIPTSASTFVLLNDSSGRAEVYFQPDPDNASLPGNDILMSIGAWGANADAPGHPGGFLGNQCVQWRTLAHELGHSLGLRHSGIDGGINGYNPPGRTYNSLMSYDYQFSGCGSSPSTVQSYSGAGDPTFNDWQNLKPEFHVTPLPLGVTTPASGFGDTPDVVEPESTVADYIKTEGDAPDTIAPSVAVTSPASGAVIPLNAPLTVNVTTTDNVCVTSVEVEFDANGDGVVGAGELVSATSLGGSSFQATFSSVTGSSGNRVINAYATDCAGNITLTTVTIGVGSVITGVSVSPVLFDPAVRSCAITATGGVGLQPEARIKNANNVYVRTVSLPAAQGGVYSAIWDGRDGTNAIVAAGTYTIEVWNSLANTKYTPSTTAKIVLGTRIWRVNNSAPGPTHDGTTWGTAFLKVQDGINAAISGDDVWVAAGTYTERITLKSEVALYGGFAGTETARDQRNFHTNVTIIDGAQGGSVVTLFSSLSLATVLDGFTIRNGGLPNYGTSQGGGIYLTGPATIANNVITGNRASTSGAGLYLWTGTGLITNNTFTGNATIGSGGGMWIQASTATIVNNLISQNTAKSGGGAYLILGSPLFLNNTVANNLALANGGGAVCDNTAAALVNNIVSANSSGVFRTGAGTPSFAANCVWGNPGYGYSGIADPTGVSGNISADPQFALVAYGNTHLEPTSPCVDAGAAGYAVGNVDIDGQPRIQGAGADIGADESDGTTGPTTHAILRVSPSGNDANDGSTWLLAKRTVQAAIGSVATGGAEIWVQAGTYSERITPSAYTYVFGGFAGTETARAQRNWATNASILDGGAAGSVVTIGAPGFALVTVDGFTIRNGSGANVQGITSGGGLYCRDSAPVVGNCTFTANAITAYSYGGGGLFAYYAAPSVVACTFTGNTSSATGGAVSGYYSAISLSGCNIAGNTSTGLGGGVYGYQTALSLSGCSITSNVSGGNFPSGIYCDSLGLLTCSGVTVTGNKGDGIVSVQSATTISSCTINGQVAGRGIFALTCPSVSITGNTIWGNLGTNRGPGGGICVSSSTGGSILGNFIFSNTAQNNAATFGPPVYPAQVGGGIYLDSPLTVANNAIYGNLANGAGGGVYCALSSPALVNNTIVYNNAVTGGGVCLGAGAPSLVNTIVAFNSSGVSVTGGTATLRDNCVYGNTGYLGFNYSGVTDPTGTNGNIAADPLLASAVTGDVHIQSASPCKDAGDSTAVLQGWTDVYGQPRIQGSAVDIGAEESPGSLIPPVTPPVIFVRPTGSDANSGATWALAKQTLTGALSAAVAGDEIWAAAGTYLERITLKSGVPLIGGFSGSETLNTQRNVSANVAIIDGGAGGSVVTVPAYSLPATVLDGFTIRNGTGTTRSDGYAYGGGIYGANASPTIANCTLTANTADKGAALFITFGAPIITNLTATGNTANVQAVVQFNNAMAYLTSGAISGNTGTGLSLDGNGKLYASGLTVNGNSGRGIVTSGAVASITACTVTGQTGGSGIYLSQCPLVTVAGCTVSGNTGTNLGAGLYVDSTVAGFIGGNTITGNVSSAQGGGMLVLNNTALTVANNLFQANIADSYGGGIYVSSGACQLTNNTLVQNTAANGGGVAVSGGTPTFANNILAFNTSGLSVSGGAVSLKDNCAYANTANQGYNYSGVADPTGTNGNISADPLFVNLAVGNVRIQGNSPCVDAGDSTFVQAAWTDLYSQPRVQGARVDIGAAESDGTVYPPPVARILYVSKSGSDANTGLSWAAAKLTVGAASAMALPGDEIWTAAGTYAEHLTLANGAKLYGGFAGTESQRSARNVPANPTLLDGSGAGTVVVFPLGALPSTTIDGFTVRNGVGTAVPGYGGDTGGGGIMAVATSATIANCTVTQNNATYGSGVFSWRSNTTVSASSISQNLREGVAIWGGNVTLNGTNIATNLYDGVAVSNTGIVTVSGCQITGNGHIGVSATGGSLVVTGSTISGQTTYGGLNLANCASLQVQGCTISGNAGAPSGGGIYAGYAGSASILNNTITGNTTIGDGGGIWVNQGAIVANNLITNNGAAGNGGGVYLDGTGSGAPSIINNTLTGNFAVGGALHVNAGVASLVNNIVFANSSGIRVTAGTAAIRANCVYANDVANYIGWADPTGLNGNISVDPRVLVYGPQAGHIQAGSPCVDTGDSTVVQAGWTDIDGQPRIQGAKVDIGADESNGVTYIPVNPPVVYVRPAGSDANDGSTWALAKKTIGAALIASQTGGEVWAAAGVYAEHLNLQNRVSLYGGFAGSESLKSQRNWITNVTVLDGSASGSVGLFQPDVMRTARIDGFTLRNGSGTYSHRPLESGNNIRGGAILINNAALALANCIVSGNTTTGSGGGVAAYSSSLALTNCTVTGNTAGSDFYNYGGGGIYVDGATLGVSGGSFTSNQVTGSTLEGSAICGVNNATVIVAGTSATGNLGFADTIQCRFGSSLSISNSTISSNASRGVSVDSGPALISGCTISGNGSNGVYLRDCVSASIQNCRITGNKTGVYVSSGDAPYFVFTTGLIADNVIANNTMPSAPGFGGGGLFLATNQTVASNAIYGNTSSTNGGGIYIPAGSPQVLNNTIVSNTSAAGGGIYLASGSPTIVNNIVASNSSGVTVQSGAMTLRNNDAFSNTGGNYTGVSDPTGTNGNIGADPLFVDTASANYHLRTGSPCINSGDDSVVAAGATDVDGNPRRIGAHVDIGAYEYLPPGYVTTSDLAASLRIAGGLSVASATDLARLNLVEPGTPLISLADAVRIARKLAGLDPNP